MGSCARNRKRLNAYIDGELTERERRSVARHLAVCPSCRLLVTDYQGLGPALLEEEVPPVPIGLASRILAEASSRPLRREHGRWTGITANTFPLRAMLVRGATAAALTAGLALGGWMGWSVHRSPGSEQRVSVTAREDEGRRLYAMDVLGAGPQGSIEAATLALLNREQ
jgi:anti-sigma factor RsiW